MHRMFLTLLPLSLAGCATLSQLIASLPSSATTMPTASDGATVLFGIGVHIEPFGAEGRENGPNYTSGTLFSRHCDDIEGLADVVEKYNGVLTIEAQTPFSSVASEKSSILRDLHRRGHDIGLHFHEDTQLHNSEPEKLSSSVWCQEMKSQISIIEQASGASVRYMSGGALYPDLLDAAECAGIDVTSEWKNRTTQQIDSALLGVNPWRPSAGPSQTDISGFATHSSRGPVIFLPPGDLTSTSLGSSGRALERVGGEAGFFSELTDSLAASIKDADPDKVNVFQLTVHPGDFRGSGSFGSLDDFLSEVIDPLVKSGTVQWATYAQMADAFKAWETTHPGASPRG